MYRKLKQEIGAQGAITFLSIGVGLTCGFLTALVMLGVTLF